MREFLLSSRDDRKSFPGDQMVPHFRGGKQAETGKIALVIFPDFHIGSIFS